MSSQARWSPLPPVIPGEAFHPHTSSKQSDSTLRMSVLGCPFFDFKNEIDRLVCFLRVILKILISPLSTLGSRAPSCARGRRSRPAPCRAPTLPSPIPASNPKCHLGNFRAAENGRSCESRGILLPYHKHTFTVPLLLIRGEHTPTRLREISLNKTFEKDQVLATLPLQPCNLATLLSSTLKSRCNRPGAVQKAFVFGSGHCFVDRHLKYHDEAQYNLFRTHRGNDCTCI